MAGRRFLGLRWITITLIMLGAIINYLTRNTLGVAVGASDLLEDLGITEVEYSWVILAFQLTIMMQFAVGYILDTIGLRRGMSVFALVWSIACVSHAWVTNWVSLAALRSVMGFAEGSANPSGVKVVSVWFPARERGFAAGFFNIGASAGSMLAPPLVAGAIVLGGWQFAFIATGLLGFAWAVAWFLFYRDPDKQPRLSDEERALIAEGQEKNLKSEGKPPPILSILATRNFWGISLPRFLADPTWGTLSFWLPLYLTQVRGFDLAGIAMFAWMPFLAADLGCFCGPTIVHFLQKRGVSLINARRVAFTVGALMMIGVMFVDAAQNAYVGIALLCLAGFAHQTLSVTVITMASDLYKQNEVATVAGMAGFFGNFSILISSLLIGALVLSVGYGPFFIALGVLDLIGVVVIWSLVRDPQSDQRIPFWFPLAVGAVLAAILSLYVKAHELAGETRYYVGELTEKTFHFYPWVYYFNWALAIGCFLLAAYLLFARRSGGAPKPA